MKSADDEATHRDLRRAEWLFLGLILSVIALVFAVGLANRGMQRNTVETARANCLDTTRSRVQGAARAATDWSREDLLAKTDLVADDQHRRSASEALQSAQILISLSGLPEESDPLVIALLDPDSARVKDARKRYCEKTNPYPSFFG